MRYTRQNWIRAYTIFIDADGWKLWSTRAPGVYFIHLRAPTRCTDWFPPLSQYSENSVPNALLRSRKTVERPRVPLVHSLAVFLDLKRTFLENMQYTTTEFKGWKLILVKVRFKTRMVHFAFCIVPRIQYLERLTACNWCMKSSEI